MDPGGEMVAQLGVAFGDLLERGPDRLGHGQAGALGVRGRAPPVRRCHQLREQRLPLFGRAAEPAEVAVALRLRPLRLELAQPLAVGCARPRVEAVPGIAQAAHHAQGWILG